MEHCKIHSSDVRPVFLSSTERIICDIMALPFCSWMLLRHSHDSVPACLKNKMKWMSFGFHIYARPEDGPLRIANVFEFMSVAVSPIRPWFFFASAAVSLSFCQIKADCVIFVPSRVLLIVTPPIWQILCLGNMWIVSVAFRDARNSRAKLLHASCGQPCVYSWFRDWCFL